MADMVRFDRALEIIEEDKLIEHAADAGDHLLDRLREMESESEHVSGARGRGMMCAFDLPSAQMRDAVIKQCMEEGVIILCCGTRAVRFRTPITITTYAIDHCLDVISRAIHKDEVYY